MVATWIGLGIPEALQETQVDSIHLQKCVIQLAVAPFSYGTTAALDSEWNGQHRDHCRLVAPMNHDVSVIYFAIHWLSAVTAADEEFWFVAFTVDTYGASGCRSTHGVNLDSVNQGNSMPTRGG